MLASSCATQRCLRMQQVTRQLAAGVVMPVRVTGPVGRTTDRTLDHPVLLIFAGGVGVSFSGLAPATASHASH